MTHQNSVTCLVILLLSLSCQDTLPYKNSNLSAEERTEDLLSRMTLEEKVGQMLCPLGWEMYTKLDNDSITHSAKFEEYVKTFHIGMLWAVYRADPWTKKTIETGLNPYLAAKAGNALQKYVMEKSRLGIPIFIAEEAPHGHMAIGATVFPTGIGLASTWYKELLTEVGQILAKEIRLQGGHISYGPVLDLARDPRWSRVEETFGECPTLTGKLGEAMIKGTGGGKINQPFTTIATLKHFIAYGVSEGGHNGNAVNMGRREISEMFLPPFKMAIDAGALSVMTAYNSVDGIPNTSNTELLKNVLHKEWGFKGFVVSDLESIEGLKNSHHIAGTMEDAAILAANAGVDVDLGGNAYKNLINAVKEGNINRKVIDDAVRKILKLKFEMGLFENPYVNTGKAKEIVGNKAAVDVAKKVAQMSVVLLKNNGILPLNANKINKVAVIGPNADNLYNMLGDYTAPQKRENIKTVLDGIKSKLGTNKVEYAKGCAIRETSGSDIEKAVKITQSADVAIVVVGGSSARDFKTSYKETGAAIVDNQYISDMESGEGFDRATLALMGKQNELLEALKKTGKLLVVVYIQGRPLAMNWAEKNADALLTAWYPGQEGGTAIADILFGDCNPSGKLPISIPQSVGQLPVYYNHRMPKGHDYVEMSRKPLYPFGFGLSYTHFEYSDLTIKKTDKEVILSLQIANIGNYDGDEVVQLYFTPEKSSTVRPVKQLLDFERISLKKGEQKNLQFTIDISQFSIIDSHGQRVTESGNYKFMIGSSSEDIRVEDSMVFKQD